MAHCGAGCVLGNLIAEWVVFAAGLQLADSALPAVGLFGWMAIMQLVLFPSPHLAIGTAVFWFLTQEGMLVGFITTYPVNWWLSRRGIKDIMQRPAGQIPQQGRLSDDCAAAFDEDDVAPAAVVAADAFPGPHDAESGGSVQDGAGGVLGKIPDWIIQIPAASVESIKASRSARPVPWPRAAGWT